MKRPHIRHEQPDPRQGADGSHIPSDPHDVLTEREQTVLSGIARGLSNREIASELYLSVDTVKSHARRIYDKLGVRNRTEATVRTLTSGTVDHRGANGA